MTGVEDIDRSLKEAVVAGASEEAPKQAVPGMGWAAYFRDPEGNIVGLWQADDVAG